MSETPLRAAALIAALAGAVGSVGFTLYAGRHNHSRLLVLLFVLWVLWPFVAMVLATVIWKGWPVDTQATFHILMLILAIGSLAIYGYVALGPPRAQTAFAFLVVPAVSLLVIAISSGVALWWRRRT